MEIKKTTYSGSASKTTKKKKVESGSFSAEMASTAETSSTYESSYTPNVGALNSILSLQEVSIEDESKKRAKNYGNKLLDQLDQLKNAVLSGRISLSQLEQLQKNIETARPEIEDLRLSEIIDEIELRARVEIAKYKKYNTPSQ